jgi:hypothetical protein
LNPNPLGFRIKEKTGATSQESEVRNKVQGARFKVQGNKKQGHQASDVGADSFLLCGVERRGREK